MKIEFDTMTATFTDAEALVAMLVARYGAGVVPASYERVGEVERATGPVTLNIHHPAPDGYPTPDGTASAPTEAPARDSAGIPWDERIHASTKTTTANGQWTRRRNTPDATFDAVMAELKAANTARTLEAATSLVPTPPPATTAAEAFAPPVPPPVALAPPAPPAPPATGAAPTFLEIMNTATAAQRDGKLDKPKLDELLAAAGLDGIAKLVAADANTRSTFSALLSAHVA